MKQNNASQNQVWKIARVRYRTSRICHGKLRLFTLQVSDGELLRKDAHMLHNVAPYPWSDSAVGYRAYLHGHQLCRTL